MRRYQVILARRPPVLRCIWPFDRRMRGRRHLRHATRTESRISARGILSCVSCEKVRIRKPYTSTLVYDGTTGPRHERRVNATVKPRKSLGVNFIARSTSRRWYERGEELGENALRQLELWLALPPDMSAELAVFLRAQAEKLYIQHPRISACKCCQDSRSNFRASN